MKAGRMQAKDIDRMAVLRTIAKQQAETAARWGRSTDGVAFTAEVSDALGVHYRLFLAKARTLKKAGLVEGCDCGCRGDWRLTDEGRATVRGSR